MNKNSKAKDSSRKMFTSENLQITKRILNKLFENHKTQIFIIVALVIFASIVQVARANFISNLIDEYIPPLLESANPDFGPLKLMLFKYSVIFALGLIATLVYSRMMTKVSETYLRNLKDDMFTHMEKLPISYFDTHSHGDIMSLYTNDVQTLSQLLSQALPMFLSSAMTVIAVTISMILTSPIMFVVVILSVILLFAVTSYLGGKSGGYFSSQQSSLGEANGYIEEMVEGQKVIKVFTHEDKIIEEFEEINDRLQKNTMYANRYALIMMPASIAISNLQYVFIAVTGGLLAINETFGVTVGMIAGFLQLSRSFSGPLRNITQQMNMILLALAGAKRIFTFLDEEIEVDEGNYELVRVCENEDGSLEICEDRTGHWAWRNSENPSEELIPLRGDIRFYNVYFSYDGEHEVLHDINLFAKPGQKIAFVGHTGAGKTTITNLINRFYDVDSGSITYDGIDVKDIKKHSLRASLGLVLQDTHLFTGSIKYNLSFGNLDATDEQVEEAAKKVQADHFISILPQGYDTEIVGTDSGLSQGQEQLMSIARAELYNPPVLILDEATSSIDSRTERIVQDSMDELMKGRTSFVIAHRLSTVKNANAIMVMENGRIIERGDHDDLMAQKGVYYNLYMGGFEEYE